MSPNESIAAVRAVLDRLTETPLAIEEAPPLGLLMEDLPLVDAALFGALPGDIHTSPANTTFVRPATGAIVVPRSRRAPVVERLPVPPHSAGNARPVSSPDRPVFKLRRNQTANVPVSRERTGATRAVPDRESPALPEMNLSEPDGRPAAARADREEKEYRATQVFSVLNPAVTSLRRGASPPSASATGGSTAIPSARATAEAGGFIVWAFARLDPLATELLVSKSAQASAPQPVSPKAAAADAANQDVSPGETTAPATRPTVESRTLSKRDFHLHDAPASSAPGVHADQLASLINEVLAEQARRHGVDLS